MKTKTKPTAVNGPFEGIKAGDLVRVKRADFNTKGRRTLYAMVEQASMPNVLHTVATTSRGDKIIHYAVFEKDACAKVKFQDFPEAAARAIGAYGRQEIAWAELGITELEEELAVAKRRLTYHKKKWAAFVKP